MSKPPLAKRDAVAPAPLGLRLYIARATPNSVRAEQNLRTALDELDGHGVRLPLEIVDVFTNSKRALNDGVIVTPTLFGLTRHGRTTIMGDLADTAKLRLLLSTLQDDGGG